MENNAQHKYFQSMLSQLEDNKLQEADLYQLFQDMVNVNYVWDKPVLALHSRMLIEKKMIKPPKNYVHRKVQPQEIIEIQKLRCKNKETHRQ